MTVSEDLKRITPQDYRAQVRDGRWPGPNREVCPGYAQTALVVVPRDWAFEFLLLCQRNPSLGQVLDVTEKPGEVHSPLLAPDADVRTDVSRYRVYKDGALIGEPAQVVDYWRDDLVTFHLGCSRAANDAFAHAGVSYRVIGLFDSTLPLVPAGRFRGNMAVSCRAFPTTWDVTRAIQESSRLTAFHGAPVHIGDPGLIGISDLSKPDYPLPYPAPPLEANETPMFWGCAVTPQKIAVECQVPYMIVSYEGHLFVTDRRVQEFQSL